MYPFDDEDDFDDDYEDELDDDELDGEEWSGHFGGGTGEEDDEGSDEDDANDEQEDDNGEGDGYGEDIGDGYGEDENPEDDEMDGDTDKKSTKEQEQDVEGKVENKDKSSARKERQYLKDARQFGATLPIGMSVAGRCPYCKQRSVFKSKKGFDIVWRGLIRHKDVYYCFNRKCKNSYWRGKFSLFPMGTRWSAIGHKVYDKKNWFQLFT